MAFIMRYFRDNKELKYEEWKNLLDMDMYVEQKNSEWDIRGKADNAIEFGIEFEMNEHVYYVLEETHFDTAKELIDEMIEYYDGELLDAIEQFSERECQMILKYIPRARIEAEYFVLGEENYE